MSRSDERAGGLRRPGVDWPGWASLAWAAAFGLIYARSMLRARLPGLLAALVRSLGG